MAKNIKRMFALVMAIVMVLGLGVSALASTDMNKTAKWSDEKYVADVTLSVGGESEDLSSDIIFVMGAGPSYGLVDCQNLVKKMMVATDGTDAKIKFGIVTFADTTENEIVLPLTEMKETDPTNQDPSDMDYIITNAILNAKANGQSVNLHSSLETAFNLLKADTSVPNNRKHVFVFTTGLGYFFDTAAGNPATITTTDSNGDPCWGNKAWLAVRNGLGSTGSGYPVPYGLSWNEYWSLICNWVETDGDTYAYVLDEIYEDFRLSNGTESAIKFGYQITDADDKAAAMEVKVPYFPKATVPFDMLSEEEISALSETELAYAKNANHAMNYERGQYEAWQTVNAMRASGCKVYPIQCSGSSWNKAGQISKGYMDMLAGGTCPTVHQAGYFTPIENEILYSVGAGSYVDDYMGYGDEYNFDFVDELGSITLKVGTKTYLTSEIEAKTGYDSSYAFTAPGAEVPTFWLDYVKGNGTNEEMFKWSFGESASNDIPVVLDYQVRLVESPENLADELVCDTNKVATLYPNGGTPEEFPVPKVTLTPVTYTVTFMNGDTIVQKTTGHKTGEAIPGCVAPEDYSDDTNNYTFDRWELFSGTEGENGTVGTTDLVYTAVFTESKIPTYTVTYVNEDGTVAQQTDGHKTGDPIPGCTAPEGYTSGDYIYSFSHWQITGGTEGADGTVGSTDLVYTAVFTESKVPTYTVTFLTDYGTVVQQTSGLKTGDSIPTCAGLPSYTAGGYTYTFVGWNQISGIVGAGNTVGNTDLVFQAVMSYTTVVETPTYIEDKVPLAAVPSVFGDDHFAYIVGYPDGNVRPEGKITRAEVATIFFRLLSEEVRQMMFCEENDFSDVNKGYWYNNAISTMAAMGIVEGYPDGTFRPDEYITRAEFAAIAARFELEGNPEGNFFNDTEGHWAEELINIAANNGWVEGYPDGSFRPDNDITRAEAMTLVNRVLHRIPEFETDLLDGMVEWPDNMDVRMWYYLAVQEATNSHDYKRKENPIYETWVDLRENRDWTELEY